MAAQLGTAASPEPQPAPTNVAAKIADQPAAWARAATLSGLDATRQALPQQGARVAIVGCRTSSFMAQSFAALREGSGHCETDTFPTSKFPVGSYDTVVALTRRGTTTEVLSLLHTLSAVIRRRRPPRRRVLRRLPVAGTLW
jgi:fructoselysine-6-P-deglycase FrlB-like protein